MEITGGVASDGQAAETSESETEFNRGLLSHDLTVSLPSLYQQLETRQIFTRNVAGRCRNHPVFTARSSYSQPLSTTSTRTQKPPNECRNE